MLCPCRVRFGVDSTLDLAYIVYEGNSGMFKNNVLPIGTLPKTLDLKKFRNCTSILSQVLST